MVAGGGGWERTTNDGEWRNKWVMMHQFSLHEFQINSNMVWNTHFGGIQKTLYGGRNIEDTLWR